jgi:hypothetical protein
MINDALDGLSLVSVASMNIFSPSEREEERRTARFLLRI